MTVTTLEQRLAASLLATDADTATQPAGPCAICPHPILRGERYARLPSGRYAHVPCVGRLALAPRHRMPVIR